MAKKEAPLSPTLATSFHAYLCGSQQVPRASVYQDVKQSVDSLPTFDNASTTYDWHPPLPQNSSVPVRTPLVDTPTPSSTWTPTKIFWIFGSFLLGIVLVSRLIDLAIAKYNETEPPTLSDEEQTPRTSSASPLQPVPPAPPEDSYLSAYMKAPLVVKPMKRRRRKRNSGPAKR
jgi:hypothetical protein